MWGGLLGRVWGLRNNGAQVAILEVLGGRGPRPGRASKECLEREIGEASSRYLRVDGNRPEAENGEAETMTGHDLAQSDALVLLHAIFGCEKSALTFLVAAHPRHAKGKSNQHQRETQPLGRSCERPRPGREWTNDAGLATAGTRESQLWPGIAADCAPVEPREDSKMS